MATQSKLVQYFNFSIISDTNSFKCMSLNSTFFPQNASLEIEGCVPKDLNVMNLTTYSYYRGINWSRATCLTDNCNNFQQNGDILPPVDQGLQCYSCYDQESCQNPELVTCNDTNAFATIQKLRTDYTFNISSYFLNPPSSYSCYSSNVSFLINGASNIWPDLVYKGCIFEDFDACSQPLVNQLSEIVESCYTCDTDACNIDEHPDGYGTCYICKNYPCLDEDVVKCDQSYANATYKVLQKMYSNFTYTVSDNFDCFALESSYQNTGM